MINWYEMNNLAHVLHAELLHEAEQKRLFARRATRVQAVPLRSRLGQTLIDLGRWVYGRSDTSARYDVERTSAH